MKGESRPILKNTNRRKGQQGMQRVFVLNIKRDNWAPCIKYKIFGIKIGAPTPAMNLGDILLARMLKNGSDEYGVKGIWYFKRLEQVTHQTFAPWKDAEYVSIIHYNPLIPELKSIFSEDFRGWQSTKIAGLAQIRLNGSVISLHSSESNDYLRNIISELGGELDINAEYNGKSVNVKGLLQSILGSQPPTAAQTQDQTVIPPISMPPKSREPQILGARLDSPILNYEPVNEMGVVILFGFYMKELGFSHLEQIQSKYPDAIGMVQLPNGRLRRAAIEFEYESKTFEQHGHDPKDCDIIICWVHNWKNCPQNLQIIEMKSFIENSART